MARAFGGRLATHEVWRPQVVRSLRPEGLPVHQGVRAEFRSGAQPTQSRAVTSSSRVSPAFVFGVLEGADQREALVNWTSPRSGSAQMALRVKGMDAAGLDGVTWQSCRHTPAVSSEPERI